MAKRVGGISQAQLKAIIEAYRKFRTPGHPGPGVRASGGAVIENKAFTKAVRSVLGRKVPLKQAREAAKTLREMILNFQVPSSETIRSPGEGARVLQQAMEKTSGRADLAAAARGALGSSPTPGPQIGAPGAVDPMGGVGSARGISGTPQPPGGGGGTLGRLAEAGGAAANRGSDWLKKYGGPAAIILDALYLADSVRRGVQQRKQAQTIRDAAGDITPESVLMRMQDQELLASREARLMRTDPQAYEALQVMLNGAPPRLAPGEFMVGGQASPGVGGMTGLTSQDILAALS